MAHRTQTRIAARATGAALTVGALTLALAGPATAAPTAGSGAGTDDGTVTITVDADALAQLCDIRIPQVLERANGALTTIQAGPATKGSAAWVRARAKDAAAAGHDDVARRLEFRADQRLGHVDELERLVAGVERVQANICSQVAP